MTDFLVGLGVVLSNQTEPHIGNVALRGDLGISRKITYPDKRETVHSPSPLLIGLVKNELSVTR